MSPPLERFAYGMLSAAAVTLMLPLAVNLRIWSGPGGPGLAGLEAAIEVGGIAWLQRVLLLFAVGWVGSAVCLYLALSAGCPRASVQREHGVSRCARCGAELPWGATTCPDCLERERE